MCLAGLCRDISGDRCCRELFDGYWFFKQKTAYEMRISDWSSDVFSSERISVGAALETNRINHVAAALPGRHVFKYVVTHIQCADSGGPVQLVPRKRIKITIDGLHVDGLVGYCLGAVDQHIGTGIKIGRAHV